MRAFLLSIDRISAWSGKAFAWTVVLLTLVVGYEVIVRKAGAPTNWAFDVAFMLFGVLFMMGGAYTLSRNGHVRGDLLYRTLSPRVQASMDVVLYFVFFIPGIAALVYAGWEFAGKSWALREASSLTGSGLPVYPFKTIIPIAGTFLLLQALAEIIRCVLCIRSGEWPKRLHDVEEADIDQLKSIVQSAEVRGGAR
ncbi:MAG: TRAP transporter small permease subunit [Burkholderiales bacterium]|nr:TRAP transporter small permease subunit [Burkholderiales bacterium]